MGLKYRDPKTGQFKDINVKTSDTLPIGAVVSYAGLNAPTGWLICDGRAISRTTYANLFAIIGTQYGVGDGSTTFNIPNLKGKIVVGLDGNDADFNTIGKTGGEKTHTLSVDEMPSHSHYIYDASGGSVQFSAYTAKDNGTTGSTETNGYASLTGNIGSSQPHNNLQPYQVQNYIIKAFQSAGVMAQVAQTETTSSTNVYSCDYINEKLKSEPKITVWTSSTPMITADNEEIRCIGNDGTVSSLLLSFLDTLIFTDSTKFSSSIVFKTSSNGCSFAVTPPTSVSFKMAGDDVTDGNFSPQPNKVYDIVFYWNGFYLNGIVKGVEYEAAKVQYKITINNSAHSIDSVSVYEDSDINTKLLGTVPTGKSLELTLDTNVCYLCYGIFMVSHISDNVNCTFDRDCVIDKAEGLAFSRVTISNPPASISIELST